MTHQRLREKAFTPELYLRKADEVASFGNMETAAFLRQSAIDAKDAERWRYLVAENNKGGLHGKYCICWYDPKGEGYITTSGVSCDGKDDQAIVQIIDADLNADREKE